MKARRIFISILLSLLLGLSSGLLTVSEISNWYARLEKPTWNPPNWIFAPVWTILYIMMGISFGMIWSIPGNSLKAKAILVFIIQFLFNLLWSFLFFKLHWIGVAMLEVWMLFVFIVLTIIVFYRINRTAAFLLVPYLFWVLFASLLNTTIWTLNR